MTSQVQAILIGVVAAFVLLMTIVGPEYELPPVSNNPTYGLLLSRNHSSHFEKAKTAFEEGGGRGELEGEDDMVPVVVEKY
jgi:SHS family lactate transporter-like MFS transporter